jgi:choline kinase
LPRFTTTITQKKENTPKDGISVALLSAGNGSRIKSYEPRSLLKIKGSYLLEHQIKAINASLDKPEIITVVGCHANRVIKRTRGKSRFVENQIHEISNSSESLRLAFNNSTNLNFLFIHGDLYFNPKTLDVSFEKSFVIVDSKNRFKDSEVGITKNKERLSILSYGLPEKWAQIAFVTGQEYQILKNIFNKYEDQDKKRLSFEIINRIVEMGGKFACYEPRGMKITEIDRIRDIK